MGLPVIYLHAGTKLKDSSRNSVTTRLQCGQRKPRQDLVAEATALGLQGDKGG